MIVSLSILIGFSSLLSFPYTYDRDLYLSPQVSHRSVWLGLSIYILGTDWRAKDCWHDQMEYIWTFCGGLLVSYVKLAFVLLFHT